MNFFFKISIDQAKTKYISGWCFYRFDRLKKVDLELCVDKKVIAETTAEIFREDLQVLGIHPTGECGFELLFDHQSVTATASYLEIKPKYSKIPIAKIATDGFAVRKPLRVKQLLRSLLSQSSIIFIHIPKTAGTSSIFLLNRSCSRMGMWHMQSL